MVAGDRSGAAALEAEDPAQIGPYRLLGRLGSGGAGAVFLGSSAEGRPVAIKVASGRLADEAGFREGLLNAAVAHQAVMQGHLVPVIDAGQDAGPNAQGRPWVATAYLEAPPLARLIAEQGPLSADALREVALGLAEALAALHEAGVIHGDLGPSRVLMAASGPRLLDFGFVRALTTTSIGRIDLADGDPGLLCPEEIRGTNVSAASDVYGLGVVLHYAATGALPFRIGEVSTAYERADGYRRIVHDEPDLTGVRDPAIRSLVAACLAK
ncbi:protein kinase, partial [Streptomyces sp. T-3]|nr:protein kinase [Streptomyces sp. T-3]